MIKQIKHKKTTESNIAKKNTYNHSKIVSAMIVFLISFLTSLFMVIGLVNFFPVNKIAQNQSNQFSFKITKQISNSEQIDPYSLIELINNNFLDMVIIDTRSQSEYKAGHIVGAKNAQLYSDYQNINKSSTNLDYFYNQVTKHAKGKKLIIIYGYFNNSDIYKKGIAYLKSKNIPIKQLDVSWYEFKNNPFSWMPGNDLGNIDINRYLEGEMYKNK